MKDDGRDKAYSLTRMEAAFAMAEGATSVAAKLIHLDMADRYRVAAYGQDSGPDMPTAQALGQRP